MAFRFYSDPFSRTERGLEVDVMDEMASREVQRRLQRRPLLSESGAKPVLLSGGNPQIAKADGDAPVQAYIAAMPGWKSDLGRRLDALIVREVPNVRKAVRWNSPFYGIEGQGWFVSYHVFVQYVKVTFFRGASLGTRSAGLRQRQGRALDQTSTRANSTKSRWPSGSGRRRPCPVGMGSDILQAEFRIDPRDLLKSSFNFLNRRGGARRGSTRLSIPAIIFTDFAHLRNVERQDSPHPGPLPPREGVILAPLAEVTQRSLVW